MIVGVPAEIKDNENRIAMVPGGVAQLVDRGHTVLVQQDGGKGSGFTDDAFREKGAEIVADAAGVFERADMIVKVKEPQPSEFPLIRERQLVFTYFHFAASEELTRGMLETGATCIAYETIEDKQGHLPLLTPMSEVAGRMASQVGAYYLQKPEGGRGVMLGGVPGVPYSDVVIIGGGVVGTQAAWIAAGLGARVTILDVDLDRLRYLDDVMPANVTTLHSNPDSVRGACRVIVDVAVDQGGCIETTRPTTHSDPTYVVDGVLHYCVANMPGAVPRTSTYALTNSTIPYAAHLADHGITPAILDDRGFALGINAMAGKVTYPAVAEAFGLDYVPIETVLRG